MKRTFKGFLKAYCKELTGLNTLSLKRLTQAASTDAPRVAEPLFCLALEEGKLPYLISLAEGTWMQEPWNRLASRAVLYNDAYSWLKSDSNAPEQYAKVLGAFEAQGDHQKASRRMNALMRQRTLAALQKNGKTRYQLVRDLGINKGNLYAYLAGDDSKVSRQTAQRIMQYAEA